MTNRFFIFLLFGSLCAICACSKEKSGSSSGSYGWVSVYATVPDAPELNLFLNSNNIAASVPFGSYTLYNPVVPGNAVLKVQTTNGNTTIDTSFAITEGSYYSLFLTGSLAGIKPVVVPDSLGSVDSGFVNLRFFVLSPGVSHINFHIFKTDSTVNTIVWKNRSFSDDITNDSINHFTRFAEGTYNFYAIETNSTDTIAAFTNRTFGDTANYTLLLEGTYNGSLADTTLQLGSRLHRK